MKRWLSNLLIIVFVCIFLVSGFFLVRYWLDSRKQATQFDDLAQLMEQDRLTPPQATPTPPADPDDSSQELPSDALTSELVNVIDPKTGKTIRILPEYVHLFALNPDLVGWITIEDTNIHYPVLQTPDRIDYYLYRDFYGKDSSHGCIYVREQCDVEHSDNVVIYGHRMKDGSMFNNLLHYDDPDYYEAHKYIQFSTLTQRHTYEIIAVFTTVATASGYPYHLFIDAADAAEFDRFIADVKDLSLYETGVSASYGDKLITLSTCEYSRDNGRMVVVAKQIDNEP